MGEGSNVQSSNSVSFACPILSTKAAPINKKKKKNPPLTTLPGTCQQHRMIVTSRKFHAVFNQLLMQQGRNWAFSEQLQQFGVNPSSLIFALIKHQNTNMSSSFHVGSSDRCLMLTRKMKNKDSITLLLSQRCACPCWTLVFAWLLVTRFYTWP